MSKNNLHTMIKQIWLPFLNRFRENRKRVFEFKKPGVLRKEIDFGLFSNKAITEEDLYEILEKVIQFTPNTRSPQNLNYLYSSPDPVGLIGDWLISLVNSNVHTYEASPVFALAETEAVSALAQVAGYSEESDGIFCPGGSYSNMFAMYLALKHLFPETNDDGLSHNHRFVIFTSEQSHYSIDKAAVLLGLGAKAVRKIKCDRHGRMISDDLRQQIKSAQDRGEVPFFVNATMGSTVLGAFDSLIEINRILFSQKIWLHVDATWGGAILMSDKRRKAVEGIERADSIAVDLHKGLRAPLLCSALLIKDGKHLKNSFNIDGSYLFHDSEEEEQFQLGKKTPQCGRLGDAFKFWLMWKVRGKDYFVSEVENRFANTAQIIEMIKKRKRLWLYDDRPDFWNVCFWYVPENLRKLGGIDQCSRKDKDELENLTVRIYECMKKDGQILVNFARIKDFPAFIRLISGHNLNREVITNILAVIESLGDMLSSKLPDLLISGGDHRLQLDNRGLNYILIAPEPAPKSLVSRSSCSGSFISDENDKLLANTIVNIRSADISFKECMQNVHDRIRKILKIDSKTSIITVSSGTDAEYIPLLIAKAHAGYNGQVVNIVTGAGEIGTHSSTAAKGKYFSTVTPSGDRVRPGEKIEGISSNLKVITISQRHRLTARQNHDQDIWIKKVEESLSDPTITVLLHIVDSSKLGLRMNVIDQVERLKTLGKGQLLVTIDSCQSRTDIYRTRHYLQLGYMVMITGSKFEEGPPFSGAVIVPPQITELLKMQSIIGFLSGFEKFITKYDISGDMEKICPDLPGWMNWGLMLRWTCAVSNWEKYRSIQNDIRNKLIQNWVEKLLVLIEKYSELQLFGGGEIQPGAVGDRNTIISIKVLSNGNPLSMKDMHRIYNWLYEDMSCCLPDKIALSHKEKSVLQRPFLIGQPVDMGNFAVLRIALGINLVLSMEKHGFEKALDDDDALLRKLSLLARHYEDFKHLSQM